MLKGLFFVVVFPSFVSSCPSVTSVYVATSSKKIVFDVCACFVTCKFASGLILRCCFVVVVVVFVSFFVFGGICGLMTCVKSR